MPPTPELIEAVTIARTAMQEHPTHQLLPIYRRTIYEAMGARVRGYLALITAEYVLPIWQKAQPTDHMPDRIIALGKDVWHQNTITKAVDRQLDADWAYLDELAVTPFGFTQAFLAGFAAVKALSEVLGGDQFQNVSINEITTDQGLDPWSSDTAAQAASAYSGPVWIANSDISLRKVFWEWWLDVAIPIAWQFVEEARAD
jgi:hypothetical protein